MGVHLSIESSEGYFSGKTLVFDEFSMGLLFEDSIEGVKDVLNGIDTVKVFCNSSEVLRILDLSLVEISVSTGYFFYELEDSFSSKILIFSSSS